jgi:methyltransferase (TIGR00027 family)
MSASNASDLIALTARWTASVRAQESLREDRLFEDPWAAALAGEEGAHWLEQRSGSVAPMVIRTRFFDEFIQRIAFQNRIYQIVLLACGLDTRAFRLSWPERTRIFELDQPSVLRHKEEVLLGAGARPACERHLVEVDLTRDWKEILFQCGFDSRQPSGWLLEGFTFYIPNESITSILAEISSLAAPGSWLGFDVINSLTLTSPLTQKWVEMQASMGAPWIGSLDDPEAFLAGLGWKTTLTQPGASDAHYGRWTLPVIPVKMAGIPHTWYVTAEKE